MSQVHKKYALQMQSEADQIRALARERYIALPAALRDSLMTLMMQKNWMGLAVILQKGDPDGLEFILQFARYGAIELEQYRVEREQGIES